MTTDLAAENARLREALEKITALLVPWGNGQTHICDGCRRVIGPEFQRSHADTCPVAIAQEALKDRYINRPYCLECAHNPEAGRLAVENTRLRDALQRLLRAYRYEVRIPRMNGYPRLTRAVYRSILRGDHVHQAAHQALIATTIRNRRIVPKLGA